MKTNERCFLKNKEPQKNKKSMRESFYTPQEFQELMHYAKLIGIYTAEDLKRLEKDAAVEGKKPLEYIKDYYYNELGGSEFKLKESINRIETGLKYIKNKGLRENFAQYSDDFDTCVRELQEAFSELKEKYLR